MRRLQFITGAMATAAVPAYRHDRIAEIERSTGGRLGVYVLDTGSGKVLLSRRIRERFPMCSTFKFLAVSAVLAAVDAGREQLHRRLPLHRSDILQYAPVAQTHVERGYMTVGELCAAAIIYSDNTAANLLVGSVGGPHAVTRYARSLGDTVTRLDRVEPALNTAIPGDVRDTTSPLATARDMHKVLLGDALSRPSRTKLIAWMRQCTTGSDLIRAGIPASWKEIDKTGTGARHNAFGDSDTRNDIAILYPPNHAPLIVTAYLTGSKVRAAEREAALAAVGAAVAQRLASTG